MTEPERTDEELLHSAREGDEDAFGAFVRRHTATVHRCRRDAEIGHLDVAGIEIQRRQVDDVLAVAQEAEAEIGDGVVLGRGRAAGDVEIEHVVALAADVEVEAGAAGQVVVAATALQRVGARAAEQLVVVVAAAQPVVAGITPQHVAAGTALGRVVALAAPHQVVAVLAAQPVVAGLAAQLVGIAAAVQRVVAGAAPQPVLAGAAVEAVVAGLAQEAVMVAAAAQPVVPGAAIELVAAVAAVEAVRTGAAIELVVPGAADQPVAAGEALDGELGIGDAAQRHRVDGVVGAVADDQQGGEDGGHALRPLSQLWTGQRDRRRAKVTGADSARWHK